MSLIDVECQDSICCSKNYIYFYKEKESLLLGKDICQDYIIYLYFNLPPCSQLKKLKKATVILLKLPVKYSDFDTCSKNNNSTYHTYPLLDFFSVYSYMYHVPRLDCSRGVEFEDTGCFPYTEIDITPIVDAWYKEEIENKGIMLMGESNSRLVTYASNQYEMIGMRPRLRLIFDDSSISPPLYCIPCNISVNE